MAFWSDSNLTVAEPKRNYRWLCYLGNIATPWVAKTVQKPSFSISETEHRYINHKFYYTGAVEWQTVDITLVDPSVPDLAQSVYNALGAAGYVPPIDQSTTQTISKAAATPALGMVKIQQIGDQMGSVAGNQGDAGIITGDPLLGVQEVLEEWVLYNAWIKDINFGDLDYSSDDLTEVSLTLRYDFAKLNDDNNLGMGPRPTFYG